MSSIRTRENELVLLAVQHRPWHYCWWGDSAYVARRLLARHPELRRAATSEGLRSFHIAAGRGKFSYDQPESFYKDVLQRMQVKWKRVVELLVDPDPTTVREPSNEGVYPLFYALASSLSALTVKILLDAWEGAVVYRTSDGSSALHLAIARERPSWPLVERLVHLRRDMLLEMDSSGSLPLHLAVAQGNVPFTVVELFVQQEPKALDAEDGKKMLPFHIAALSGASLDVLYLLAVTFPEVVRDEGPGGERPAKRARHN